MNQVVLIGNLTKDVDCKAVSTGDLVARFSIAVNRGKDNVDFINCEAWGKLADNIQQYCKKGSKIAVVGSIRVENFDKDGEKRTYYKVNCFSIEFLSKKELADNKIESDF